MEITINVNVPALDRLVDAIIENGAPGAPTPKAPAKKAPAKKAAVKKAPAKKAEPEPETENEDGGDVGEDIRLAVKQAAKELSQKNGRDALAAALKDHGATKGISTLPEDQLEAFIAHCQEAIG